MVGLVPHFGLPAGRPLGGFVERGLLITLSGIGPEWGFG